MPIIVLAGVLGSGKTTLMARLAQHCIAEKTRVGMVVNDIASLGVDAALLAETGWPHAAVDSLDGACACCSDRADLEDVLQGMKELRRDLLLFETTGVADAADMLSQLTAHQVRGLVETPRLISVIDVTRYLGPMQYEPLVRRQIELADLVVLSKGDLADSSRLVSARATVKKGNPRVPIVSQPLSDDEIGAVLRSVVQHEDALRDILVDGPPGHAQAHTVSLALASRLSRARFEALLNSLPPTILRAKGFVTFADEPGLFTFNFVEPSFVSLTPFLFNRRPGVVMSSGPSNPYGVFIGTAIDEDWLYAALDQCTPDQTR